MLWKNLLLFNEGCRGNCVCFKSQETIYSVLVTFLLILFSMCHYACILCGGAYLTMNSSESEMSNEDFPTTAKNKTKSKVIE